MAKKNVRDEPQKQQVTENPQMVFVETNPCTEFWFLLHFLPNVVCRRYESYE